MNRWTFAAVTLAALAAPAAVLAQTPEHTGDNAAQFPSKTDLKALTTSGSYLAARHASVERDAASAAAFYRSALRTDPKNNELLDRAFISSLADGDIDEAVKLADRILTMDKANRVARLVVGVRDLKQKKYAAAQLNIVDSLGWAFYRIGNFEDAVKNLERAIDLKPEDPTINDHLGDAYWRVGRTLEAKFQWAHARDLKPEAEELPKIEAKIANGLPDDTSSAASADKKKEDGKGG
jgi:tetratricopeptide (TPR) repeat protein